jgi:hypothetical protein
MQVLVLGLERADAHRWGHSSERKKLHAKPWARPGSWVAVDGFNRGEPTEVEDLRHVGWECGTRVVGSAFEETPWSRPFLTNKPESLRPSSSKVVVPEIAKHTISTRPLEFLCTDVPDHRRMGPVSATADAAENDAA